MMSFVAAGSVFLGGNLLDPEPSESDDGGSVTQNLEWFSLKGGVEG